MATTRFIDHLLEGDHASRPSAGSVPQGTLYSCTTHTKVYQSDGTSTWSDWFVGAAGFTDPMTTRGDIIVRDASNVTARLAIGSSGKVLSSNGTDVSWQTPAGGGLTLLEQHTASLSPTLDFTTFISSTYDEYLIDGINVRPVSNGVVLNMQVGTGGGPTYDTGSNYYSAVVHTTSNATSANDGGNFSAMKLAHNVSNASSDYGHVSFSIRLVNPGSSTRMKNVHGTSSYHDGTSFDCMLVGGLYASNTALTAVRFLFSSGNIADGTIRAYGIAK